MKIKSDKRLSSKHFSRRLKTPLDWDDLVLPAQTLEQIREVEAWLRHGDALLNDWGMRGRVRPGFRTIFSGPSGTGKTMAAGLLGKSTGVEVYRVCLSVVISKYIGETEKNLARIFAKAEKRKSILFFDEADALFGRRTEVKDSHDRYANQEIAYLLQFLEGYEGLAIVACNLAETIDDAILRRFQSVVVFPLPDPGARLTLWEKAFPKKAGLADDVNLKTLAGKYALDPATIMNVVQYCCTRALARGTSIIAMRDIEAGIRKELQKRGSSVV